MASKTFIQSFETGFTDELQKIAACRVNAHKKLNYTKTRAGRRPIRADKLKESAAGPAAPVGDIALDLLKNKYLMGLLAGGTAGVVGHQGYQDWSLGRRVRKAQTR